MKTHCPKCGLQLVQRKNKSDYCRNGCETYTAQPIGSSYDVMQRGNKEDARESIVIGGFRREPTCRD